MKHAFRRSAIAVCYLAVLTAGPLVVLSAVAPAEAAATHVRDCYGQV
jgi:hypothetical protein